MKSASSLWGRCLRNRLDSTIAFNTAKSSPGMNEWLVEEIVILHSIPSSFGMRISMSAISNWPLRNSSSTTSPSIATLTSSPAFSSDVPGGMTPFSVEEDFEVFEETVMRGSMVAPSFVVDELGLEQVEEGFGHGVIPAVPLRLILCTKPCWATNPLGETGTGVLDAAI